MFFELRFLLSLVTFHENFTFWKVSKNYKVHLEKHRTEAFKVFSRFDISVLFLTHYRLDAWYRLAKKKSLSTFCFQGYKNKANKTKKLLSYSDLLYLSWNIHFRNCVEDIVHLCIAADNKSGYLISQMFID